MERIPSAGPVGIESIERSRERFFDARKHLFNDIISRSLAELEAVCGQSGIKVWLERLSRGANFAPGVGNAKVLTESLFGRGAGGEKLTAVDRMWYAFSALGGFASYVIGLYAAKEGDADGMALAGSINAVSMAALLPTMDDLEKGILAARNKGLHNAAMLLQATKDLLVSAPDKYEQFIKDMSRTV